MSFCTLFIKDLESPRVAGFLDLFNNLDVFFGGFKKVFFHESSGIGTFGPLYFNITFLARRRKLSEFGLIRGGRAPWDYMSLTGSG